MDAHMWLVKAWTYPDPPKVSLDVAKVEIKSINTRECETKNWSKLYNKKNFLICYLAAPQPNVGLCWGDSLTNLMLIIAFFYSWFNRKFTGSLVTRLGHKTWPSCQCDLSPELSNSECNSKAKVSKFLGSCISKLFYSNWKAAEPNEISRKVQHGKHYKNAALEQNRQRMSF